MKKSINTREDLDAITGTPEHVDFMALLAGTLWRLEKDDTAQAWVAIEDNSTIERFGFTRADFPDAQTPGLPEYVRVVDPVPEVVSRRQGRQALILAGKFSAVQAAIDAIEDETERLLAQSWWDDSAEYERTNPFLQILAKAIGLDDAALDALFVVAGGL